MKPAPRWTPVSGTRRDRPGSGREIRKRAENCRRKLGSFVLRHPGSRVTSAGWWWITFPAGGQAFGYRQRLRSELRPVGALIMAAPGGPFVFLNPARFDCVSRKPLRFIRDKREVSEDGYAPFPVPSGRLAAFEIDFDYPGLPWSQRLSAISSNFCHGSAAPVPSGADIEACVRRTRTGGGSVKRRSWLDARTALNGSYPPCHDESSSAAKIPRYLARTCRICS